MFKNIQEVKEFIEWASKMGVARAKIDGIEFDIYATKLIESSSMYKKATTSADSLSEEYRTKEEIDREEEELLFYSSNR